MTQQHVIQKTKPEEFVPTETYRTRSKPCVIHGTEFAMGWVGKTGDLARGMLYSTQRTVHDNKKTMTRTIQNASRKERRDATPMDERLRVLFREEMAVRRLQRMAAPANTLRNLKGQAKRARRAARQAASQILKPSR